MRAPGDDELLAYLDGCLDPERRKRIEHQLEQSWDLRVRLEDLRRDVETYVRAMREDGAPAFPEADDVWRRLLERIRLENAAREDAGFGPRWRAAAVASIVVALAVTALIRLSSPGAASASSVLERAQAAEGRRLREVRDPVVYQRFRARKLARAKEEAAVQWEIWTASSGGRPIERVDVARVSRTGAGPGRPSQPALFHEISSVLRCNGLDERRPLAPEAYATWLKQIRPAALEVSKVVSSGGGQNWVLTVRLPESEEPGAIQRADYMVRADDWLPVEQRLEVRQREGMVEYEIARLGFEVLSYAPLPADFFGKPEKDSLVSQPRRDAARRENHPVALSVSRRAPDVHARINELLSEHLQGSCTRMEPGRQSGSQGERLLPSPESGEGGLAHAPDDTLAASSVSLLYALLADARAIERLLEEAPPEEVAGLGPATAALWSRMLSEHLVAVASNARNLEQMLGALTTCPAGPEGPEQPGVLDPGDWSRQLAAFASELIRFTSAGTVNQPISWGDRCRHAAECQRFSRLAERLAHGIAGALAHLRQTRAALSKPH